MLTGTLDDRYLTWLYSRVANVKARRSSKTFWDLFRQMFATEFAWFVPNDDNRAEDGRELRAEWSTTEDVEVDPAWLDLGCSFLEMLIGLSRRLSFETGGDVADWFWHLINNLELTGYHDRSRFKPEDAEDRTSAVIWRTYDCRGHGGLFPLNKSDRDQRQVEIWYQLSEYLLQDS
jgi:hypothetical protein